MSALFLYDDAVARQFEPFSLTRPASELRAGALLLRERWSHALGIDAAGHLVAPHLQDFAEPGSPPVAPAVIPAGAIVANARFAPLLARLSPAANAWRSGGRIVAVRLRHPLPADHFTAGAVALESLADESEVEPAHGWWLDHVWDLVRHLAEMLANDIEVLAPTVELAAPATAVIVGDPSRVYLERGATIEPLVVLDASAGPILVRRGASVAAFTRLVGPCHVGVDSQVLGGKVATCSIGEGCRVHGEVSTTIFVGHANKGHDGFVGHSILGRWSNLGASTVTSNLKNTYGSVQLWTPSGLKDTGLQFLGTLLGDHAKTAVGTRLMTGTVVGTAANVVSDALPPKVVAPFTFGEGTYRLDKFLEVAGRVMARRHVAFGERERRWLTAVFHARWTVGA